MDVGEARRLPALEDENRRLKRIVADQTLRIQVLKQALGKGGATAAARRAAVVHVRETHAGFSKPRACVYLGAERIDGTRGSQRGRHKELFRVNVDGVFFCCQAVLPGMTARRRGNIVNISSWNGKLAAPNFGAYSATKAAVISLTQALAREVAANGIGVNAICPGIVAGTAMRRDVERQGQAFGLPPSPERAKMIPLGRLAEPEDIANAVALLASDETAYMTGQAINVTGGLWLH